MIDEEDPVEMVDLVLEDARKEIPALDLLRIPAQVEVLDLDLLGALDRLHDPGNGKAPLLARHRAMAPDNGGVDEHHDLGGVTGLAHVEHRDSALGSHLRRDETDPFGIVHRLDQVTREGGELLVEAFDGARLATEYRIAQEADL